MAICSHCSYEGTGNYCANCGKVFEVKRMTVGSLLHEVAHIFTHFEKGYVYSLKQLATRPGQMQKDFLAGDRSRHQKPFSMFFVCATLAALAIYLSSRQTSEMTHQEEVTEEFTRHYYVILQSALLPFYALLMWLLFWNKNFNYAEALVLIVYSLAFVLLLIIPVNMINFIPHHIETTFVEVPVMIVYITWTNLRFFNNQPAGWVILKSIVMLLTGFIVLQFIANQIIHWMM